MAGAFFKDTPAHYPAWAWANGFVRWWSQHFGVVYGDQSVFMRRVFFDEMGGFEMIPLMEDVAMSRKLRASGKFRLIDPPVRTSMRRFLRARAIVAVIVEDPRTGSRAWFLHRQGPHWNELALPRSSAKQRTCRGRIGVGNRAGAPRRRGVRGCTVQMDGNHACHRADRRASAGFVSRRQEAWFTARREAQRRRT